MADEDETAKTAWVIDASGAEKGAADAEAAANKVVAAEAAVGAAAESATARVSTSAAAIADAVKNMTDRVETGTSSQVRFLNRLEAQLDPLGAAFITASNKVKTLLDIVAQAPNSDNATKALSLMGGTVDALLTKSNDLSMGIKNSQAVIDGWTEKFAPATVSAQKMTAEIADLNAAVQAGVKIEIGYQNALQDIIDKYDEGAIAAKALAEAQQKLYMTPPEKAAQSAATTQSLTQQFNPSLIATAEYQSTLARVNQALAENIVNETQANAERDKAEATLTQLIAVYDGSAAAAAKAAATEKEAAEVSAQHARTLESLTAEFQPLVMAEAEYQATLARVNQAINETGLSEDAANAKREEAGATLAALTAKLDGSAAAEKEAADASAQHAKTIESLTAEFQPLVIATAEYQALLARVNQAVRETGLSETEAEAIRNKATVALDQYAKNLDKHAASTGQADFATRQLGVQTIQLFTSIEAGQPIITSFIQQFHQVIDVSVATGTTVGQMATQIGKAFSSAWAAITSPVGIVVTTIATATAAIGYLSYAAASSASALAHLRIELSATRDDYAAVADEVKRAGILGAAGTPATTAQATIAAQAIAANPAFDGGTAKLAEMTKTAVYLAQVLGEDIPAATKRLALAMQDPAKAALALASTADPLKALNAQTLDLIISLDRAGEHARAAALVYQVMSDAAKVAESQQTVLAKAFEHLSSAMHSSTDTSKGWMQEFGNGMNAVIAGLIDALADLIGKLNGVPDAVKRARDSTTASPSGTAGGNVSFWDYFAHALTGGGSLPGQGGTALPPMMPTAAVNNPALLQQQADINRSYIQSADQFAKSSADLQNVILQYVQRESSFQQLNPATGRPVTSTSGAQGLFQIMPGTAGGRDITSATGNINTGLDLFTQYAAKYKGKGVGGVSDAVLVDMAMVVGEGFTDQFIAGAKTLADLSTSKRTDIAHDTGFNVTSFLRSNPPSLPINQQQQLASDAVGGVVALANMDAQGKKVADLNDEYRKLNATLGQVEGIVAAQQFATPEQAAQIVHYSAAISQNRAEFEKTQNTLKTTTDAYHDQAAAAGLLGAAEQKFAEIQIAANRANADHPLSGASQAQVAAEQTAAMGLLAAQFDQQSKKLDQSTQQTNDNADAILKGTAAVTQATAAHKALLDVQDHFLASDPQYQSALEKRTQQYLEQADAAKKAAVNQELLQNTNTIDLLNVEINTLGMDANARDLVIQHIRDEQDVRLKYGDTLDSTQAKLLAERDQIARLNQTYQLQQTALQDLSGAFTQAFDQIGQAITNSFLSGTGAAVNWGNVMKTVAQQVLQEFLKLAVLNPLLNNLFGQHNTTLSSALGALGSLGGSGSGGAATGALGVAASAAAANDQWDLPGSSGGSSGGGSNLLNEGSSLLSIGKALFPDTFGSGSSMFSGLGESLGLTGEGGALSGITSLLNTSIIAPTAGVGEVSLGGFGSATVPTLTGGATIGSLAGGFGAGFGAGSLAGGFVQNALGKTGPGPEIGAGIGSAALVAGAALAPETFGISLLLAGLLGGTAGGVLGGLIGPKPASPFSSTTVSSGLQEGSTVSQLTDTTQEVTKLNAQLADISIFLNQNGLAESQSRTIQIGQNSPKGPNDNSKFSDLYTPNDSGHAAFSEFQFTAQDPNVNQLVSSRSYPDLQTLQTVFTATSQFVQSVANVSGFDIGKFLSGFQGVDASALQPKFAAVTTFLTQVLPTLSGLNLSTNVSANGVADFIAQFNSLADAFSGLRFTSGNGDINALINNRSFADQQTLTTVVTALNQFVTDVAGSGFDVSKYLAGLGGVANSDLPTVLAAVDQFVTQTVPTLLKFNDVTGSLNDTIAQITAQFATAIQTAHALGYQEQQLTDVRNAAITAAQNAVRHSADLSAAATNAQILTLQASGRGTLGGAANDNTSTAETAALAAFDVQRQTQIEQLRTQYQGVFGDAYATTTEFVENSTALETSLGLQRLAIQKQYNAAIAQAATQLGDQLRSYYGQFLTSQAQMTGNPADAVGAQLYNFDAQAQSQRAQLISQFQALYGDAYAQTAQYVEASTGLEQSLGEQRLAIQKQYNDQIEQQQAAVVNTQNTLQGQYLTAAAQISGNPADAMNAQLYNFDANALQQRQQLISQFKALYGSSYASQLEFVQTSALLEKSLGEQRLAIQKQSNTQIVQQQEQAAQSVTTVITSLKAYALSLQQGAASPLSLKDQYGLASSQFNAVSGSALAGDFNSVQQLQTYAQALQEASRAVNGSGAAYAADIGRIENVLSQIAMTPVGTLTSEAFTAQMKTTTQTLSGDLGDLKDLLSQMLGVLKQSKFAPTKFPVAA